MFSNGIIVKCYQGIVCRRVHYAGLTVRGTGPNITAIRLSEEAPLLTNRQITLYYNFGGSRGLRFSLARKMSRSVRYRRSPPKRIRS